MQKKPSKKTLLITDYSTYNYNDLRRLAKEKGVATGLGANPTRIQLTKALNILIPQEAPQEVVTATIIEEMKKVKEESVVDNDSKLAERVTILEDKFNRFFGVMLGALKEVEVTIPATKSEPKKVVKQLVENITLSDEEAVKAYKEFK